MGKVEARYTRRSPGPAPSLLYRRHPRAKVVLRLEDHVRWDVCTCTIYMYTYSDRRVASRRRVVAFTGTVFSIHSQAGGYLGVWALDEKLPSADPTAATPPSFRTRAYYSLYRRRVAQ